MLLSELLSPSRVIVETAGNKSKLGKLDKRAALGLLAGALSGDGLISQEDALQVLLDRESLQSTGVGEGVAIPHGAAPGLNAQCAALLILSNGIDFQSVDDEKVRILFAVIGPKRTSGEHLKTLARISRLLRNQSFRARLVSAADSAQAYALIAAEETQ
jgi:nitrogen PTS system EIIA component